ncbi:MAG: hypothetical protein JWP29_12 [Rhodoferax sp.]|nr:hypothetical protein [Rhodoferax sp.]
MKRLLRWSLAVLGVCALLLLALVVLAGLAIDSQAEAEAPAWPADITPAHIERAVRLFILHDPRHLKPGAEDTLRVQAADADLAINYFAQRAAHTRTRLTLEAGTARLQTSTRLPRTPLGDHLGIDLRLAQGDGLPRVAQMRVGRLDVPPLLANGLFDLGIAQLRATSPAAARGVDSLRQIDFATAANGGVGIRYVWPGKLAGAGGFSPWSATEQARIDAYTRVLGDAAASDAEAGPLPLARLMQALLQAAAVRSDAGGATAVAENRAALLALAQFVNAEALSSLVTALVPAGTPRPITLNGRTDTAQHFTVSAALTAVAGAEMSDAVGLYKELSDAQGGSGFSFNDLAADRAGTRFAARATAGESGARRQQRAFMAPTPASDPGMVLLPSVDDLPEDMQLAVFIRRFGGVDSPPALRVRADIERRIGSLPLYR